jgi:hypothetical protein
VPVTDSAPKTVQDGEALPLRYPNGVTDSGPDKIKRIMAGRILFSRHLREMISKSYQGTDEYLNKLLSECWERLPAE